MTVQPNRYKIDGIFSRVILPQTKHIKFNQCVVISIGSPQKDVKLLVCALHRISQLFQPADMLEVIADICRSRMDHVCSRYHTILKPRKALKIVGSLITSLQPSFSQGIEHSLKAVRIFKETNFAN